MFLFIVKMIINFLFIIFLIFPIHTRNEVAQLFLSSMMIPLGLVCIIVMIQAGDAQLSMEVTVMERITFRFSL